MKRSDFRHFLIEQFTDSLGVAAEFVVDDAFAIVDSHPEWFTHPELLRAQFLIALEKSTPSEVPFGQLRLAIVEKLKTAQLAR
jgi:hypothetical protein